MSKPFSFGKIDVGLTAGGQAFSDQPSEPGSPFRIAVLGDFSGRSSRGIVETGAGLAGRRAIVVDRDNFDDVMGKMGVELQLAAPGEEGGRISLRFKELDDFRPERIVPRVALFEKLRETRRKLSNPSTFAEAAEDVRKWAGPRTAPEPAPPAAPAIPPGLTGGALLEHILGETPVAERRPTLGPAELDLDAFVRKVVAPHVVAKADPRLPELLTAVDAATAGLLRALLHHPAYQALEAAWRSLYLLVRRLETDAQLKLYLLDVSQAELAADLAQSEDLGRSGTYRLLVEQSIGRPGAQPWAVLLGNYRFGPRRDDVELLGRLAKVAQQAGAPFLAAATPAIVGCGSFAQTPDPDDWREPIDREGEEAWQALRRLPEARYLGLTLPRFLVRLPYGKETDPVEGMTFEELSPEGGHEAYLWGNAACLCTYLLAESYTRHGWGFRPGVLRDVDGLPAHVRDQAGESDMTPCAEAYLSHRAAARIGDRGLIPVLSVQHQDRVQIDAFRSVAEPAAPLAGRWK